MRTYVLAVGGTGAKVLRSLTMLLAAGYEGSSSSDTIIPIIIDHDSNNGSVTEVQHLLECYQRISSSAFSDERDVRNTFFCSQVRDLQEMYNRIPSIRFTVNLDFTHYMNTFADHIGYHSIDRYTTVPTKYLIDALFEVSNELRMDLTMGFRGHLNIGSVVAKNIANTIEMQELIFHVCQDDRILIIGSIFGGTGASYIPTLLEIIRARLPYNIIGVIAVEPYFRVIPEMYSEINSDTFDSKTRASLDAYATGNSVNRLANAVYYVGDKMTPVLYSNAEGGKRQKNPAHVAELVAAISACDFMKRDIQGYGNYPEASFFETWLHQDDVLTAKSFGRLAELYIDPLCKLALFNQFCKNFYIPMLGERRDVWLRYTGLDNAFEFRRELETFIRSFEDWVKEMESIARPFKILNLDDNGYKNLIVGKIMFKSNLFLYRYAIRDTEIRNNLNRLYSELGENGQVIDNPRYLFLTWMEKIITNGYNTILEWTRLQEEAQENADMYPLTYHISATAIPQHGIVETPPALVNSLMEVDPLCTYRHNEKIPGWIHPSVFSRMLFFRMAFNGIRMMDAVSDYNMAVSQCLDLMERVFFKDRTLEFMEWKPAEDSHRLNRHFRGEIDNVLESQFNIYLRYFGMKSICLILENDKNGSKRVIGGTSPFSIVFTSPNYHSDNPVTSLVYRDPKFKEYVYKVYAALRNDVSRVNSQYNAISGFLNYVGLAVKSEHDRTLSAIAYDPTYCTPDLAQDFSPVELDGSDILVAAYDLKEVRKTGSGIVYSTADIYLSAYKQG